ncbi:M23 family metallopeptidase [Euzebya tangerina]|uniref:M23 family metallopeptidase n=1 Tax=Euzebya tangerina TaxID=591198 RepID=UPI000E3130B5|nr:M23 family metallopeptidase [Euzebya tangerina]
MLMTALVISTLALPAPLAAQQPAISTSQDDGTVSPGALTPEEQARIAQAQALVDQTMAQREAITVRLDSLARDFEDARAHSERLALELAQADGLIDRAEQDAQAAVDAQRNQIRSAYMQPGMDLARVSGAFLLAPDASSALHSTAVMQRVAANRADTAEAVLRGGQQVVSDVGTTRGIANGTAAAMADLEDLSDSFNAALDDASVQVEQAEAMLAAAEVDAQDAAEARADAAAAAAAVSNAGAAPLIGVTGTSPVRQATINGGTQWMTCPLGQPNGFIDSWGFPRSGGRSHQGTDMFAAYGMPLYAAADATVGRITNGGLGGLAVRITDDLGNRYYYAHLSATYVTEGQRVSVGELIGANGNSGNARTTPPHLHIQFHPGGGGPVNPYPLMAALCR